MHPRVSTLAHQANVDTRQDRTGQQVGPHVQGLIMFPEEAEEVAAPVLLDRTVSWQDVGFPEQAGYLGGSDGGAGRQ